MHVRIRAARVQFFVLTDVHERVRAYVYVRLCTHVYVCMHL